MADLSTPICVACLAPLSAVERHYYETRCELCEIRWSLRLADWLAGKADPELDQQYAGRDG